MLPSRFALGSTFSLTQALPAYPASAGWVLKLRLVPTGAGTAVALTGTASGSDHLVTATATATAAWTVGTYTWAAWVELGAQVVDIATGRIELLPNVRTASSALDLRTQAEQALDNVRATLRGKATQDVLRYTIGGRSLEHYSTDELIKLENQLAIQVRRERRAAALQAGAADPAFMQVRLGRA